MIDELLKKIMNRFYFVIFFMIIFSFVLMGKLIYIQVVEGEKYKIIASNQTIKNVVLQPSRGNIYSEYGSLMATSVAQYEVRWDSKVPSNSLYNKTKRKVSKGFIFNSQTPYIKLYESLENARKIIIGTCSLLKI